MREAIKNRITRLTTRKQEVLGQMKELRENHVRNLEHKVVRLVDQVLRITGRISQLKGEK